ncbi:hypothetical protein BJY00DRAFT_176797 [Aspergillus carlsbadensis]|nr:hypothetical protein BJY00DRAFT_176797 [Aspergillus carlsbadensis]
MSQETCTFEICEYVCQFDINRVISPSAIDHGTFGPISRLQHFRDSNSFPVQVFKMPESRGSSTGTREPTLMAVYAFLSFYQVLTTPWWPSSPFLRAFARCDWLICFGCLRLQAPVAKIRTIFIVTILKSLSISVESYFCFRPKDDPAYEFQVTLVEILLRSGRNIQ